MKKTTKKIKLPLSDKSELQHHIIYQSGKTVTVRLPALLKPGEKIMIENKGTADLIVQ